MNNIAVQCAVRVEGGVKHEVFFCQTFQNEIDNAVTLRQTYVAYHINIGGSIMIFFVAVVLFDPTV